MNSFIHIIMYLLYTENQSFVQGKYIIHNREGHAICDFLSSAVQGVLIKIYTSLTFSSSDGIKTLTISKRKKKTIFIYPNLPT